MATEWEEIQMRMGNIPYREIPKPMTAKEYDDKTAENREKEAEELQQQLEKASLDELNEIEDDFDDEAILEQYRKQRMKEFQQLAQKEKYGELVHINEQDYKKEVTEAGDVWVVVFLYAPGHVYCEFLAGKLKALAKKFKATKFVQIRAQDAIKGYPEKNLPTLLIYHKGDIKKQFIGISSFGGEKMTELDLEWKLKQVGAVESDLEEDPRAAQEGVSSKRSLTSRSTLSTYDY